MSRRSSLLRCLLVSFSVLSFLSAAPTPPAAKVPPLRSVIIDHNEIGCLVAGQFPRVNACFKHDGDLAMAQLFFRPPSSGSWYVVDFSAEGSCHVATLPKPQKSLVGTDVFIYVSGTSRNLGESRTREYPVRVVASASECKSDKPVAYAVPRAEVQVFPGVPVGFSAALPSGPPRALLFGVGAAAVIGGGVAVASRGGDDPSPSPNPTPNATLPTPTPTPVPANRPPDLVCRATPDPVIGFVPLSVIYNLCGSSDPEGQPLTYTFDFGDTRRASGSCREEHVYDRAGDFTARHCVSDGAAANERCCTYNVRANSIPPTAMPTVRPYPIGWVDRLEIVSLLQVPDATAQVIVNGEQVSYPGPGVAYVTGQSRRGVVRLEAQLVVAKGRPGQWEFDLGLDGGPVPGSLHVTSGKVLRLEGDTVVFAMSGTPGERVSFTFRR